MGKPGNCYTNKMRYVMDAKRENSNYELVENKSPLKQTMLHQVKLRDIPKNLF